MKTKELLRKAITGVINQGCKSDLLEDGDVCAYRGDSGAKCAVGHLIDDEHYNISLEGSGVNKLGVRTAVESSIGRSLYRDELNYLGRLQCCHDSSRRGSCFVELFKLNIKLEVNKARLPNYCLEFLE